MFTAVRRLGRAGRQTNRQMGEWSCLSEGVLNRGKRSEAHLLVCVNQIPAKGGPRCAAGRVTRQWRATHEPLATVNGNVPLDPAYGRSASQAMVNRAKVIFP